MIALRVALTVLAGGAGGVSAVRLEPVDALDAAVPPPTLALTTFVTSALRLAGGVQAGEGATGGAGLTATLDADEAVAAHWRRRRR